ncbi:MAG: hypothetical protein LBN18_07100 [Dysgonamonadaceae bacterium]|jgi:hypothetical protein|nr:hypothetical protein [Dysgonamonadaceae bacterium]
MLNKLHRIIHLADIVEDVKIQNKISIREEVLNYYALNSKEQGITGEKYCDREILVSLTTYGKRIHQVYLTIESLMQQSMKPNRILLWIDSRYQNQPLPQLLQQQTKRGLEIAFCKDIGSYTKLIPALKQYPNDIIITVDDDVYYNTTMIENLVSAYLQDPHSIYFNRGFEILLKKDNQLRSYNQWPSITSPESSPLNFPTGVGGVLYPPRCFPEEVFNESVFTTICPLADDVWFKAMTLYNGIPSKKVVTVSITGDEFLVNRSTQDIGLKLQNNGQKQNDKQLKAVFEKYNLFPLLTRCR